AVRRPRVIADAQHRRAVRPDAFEHAGRPPLIPPNQLRTRIERLPQQVEHAVVRIRDDYLSGATGARAGDGGIRVSSHPLPRPLVVVTFASTGWPASRGLAPRRDTRDAFHVDG